MGGKYSTIEDFELAIEKQEDWLFGVYLYYQAIKLLYNTDKAIMDYVNFHYQQIKERNATAISKAKSLLKQVKNGGKDIGTIKSFEFPPIHGWWLDKMTDRVTVLVQAYNKIFPNRPRNKELTEEEQLMLIDNISWDWERMKPI